MNKWVTLNRKHTQKNKLKWISVIFAMAPLFFIAHVNHQPQNITKNLEFILNGKVNNQK